MAMSTSAASALFNAKTINNPNPTQSALGAGVVTEAQQRKRQEAEKAAQEFETLFVDMMVKSMRQTAQGEEVSNAEDVYQGMLDSEYSKSMTTANNFEFVKNSRMDGTNRSISQNWKTRKRK